MGRKGMFKIVNKKFGISKKTEVYFKNPSEVWCVMINRQCNETVH